MNCEVCGGSLEGKKKGTKTCSQKCRKKLSRNKCDSKCDPSVTPTKQTTPTITPGTRNTTKTHRFFYYCNYIGSIEGTPTNKKGTYRLTRKDFTSLLPILNKSLQLYDHKRQNIPAIKRAKLKGPKISILFTKKNNTMALGIEHFSWSAINIPDMGINISPKEAMDADARLMMAEIENHFEGLTLDNLHTPKIRRLEGHIELPDKNVEKLQKGGLGNYRGQTTYNPGHFTLSRPGKLQTEREIDHERAAAYMDFFGNPEIEDPENVARGPYAGLDLSRYLTASIIIQNKTQEQIEQYAEALEQHNGFVKEARELISKFNNEIKARRKTDIFLREVNR